MKINNVDLNIKIQGDGPSFIWGHGLTANMALDDISGWFQWDSLANAARVIRYDARGHGKSEGSYDPKNYVWSNLAKDMVAIMDDLEIDAFVAGGQSMGCATSIYAALAAPKRVSTLVLVNPPTGWETRAEQAAIYDQLAGLVEAQGVAALVGLLKQRPLLPGWLLEAQPEVGDGYLEAVSMLDAKVLPQILRGARLCDLPARDELRTLQMPTLILAWVNDATHPISTAEELDTLLPNSRLVIAEGMDDVSTWPRLMREFITSIS